MMFVGGCSRFAWHYFVNMEFDVPAAFARFLTDVRVQGTPSMECLLSDNGTEFT